MVRDARPEMVSEKLPAPEPLVSFVSLVVGVVLVVLYTTPRSVTFAPSSAVTLPPSTALEVNTLAGEVVVRMSATN